VAKKNRRQKVLLFLNFFQPGHKFSGRSDKLLAAGAKGLIYEVNKRLFCLSANSANTSLWRQQRMRGAQQVTPTLELPAIGLIPKLGCESHAFSRAA